MVDLPGVGANLLDHLSVGMILSDTIGARVNLLKALSPPSLLSYAFKGTGPLASSSLEGTALMNTRSADGVSVTRDVAPDIQLILFASHAEPELLQRSATSA